MCRDIEWHAIIAVFKRFKVFICTYISKIPQSIAGYFRENFIIKFGGWWNLYAYACFNDMCMDMCIYLGVIVCILLPNYAMHIWCDEASFLFHLGHIVLNSFTVYVNKWITFGRCEPKIRGWTRESEIMWTISISKGIGQHFEISNKLAIETNWYTRTHTYTSDLA